MLLIRSRALISIFFRSARDAISAEVLPASRKKILMRARLRIRSIRNNHLQLHDHQVQFHVAKKDISASALAIFEENLNAATVQALMELDALRDQGTILVLFWQIHRAAQDGSSENCSKNSQSMFGSPR